MTELLVVLGLLVVYATWPTGVDPALIWVCLLLQYGLLIAAVIRPLTLYRGLRTYVTTEFLFLFFCYLIFFYPYQLHVLGIYDLSQSAFFDNTFIDQTNQAIVLSTMGTVAFRGGIRALTAPPTANWIETQRSANRFDFVSAQTLAIPVLILQLVLIAAYQAFGWKAAGEGRYTGQTTGGPVVEGVYLAIIVLSMVAVALWMLPGPSKQSKQSVFLTVAALLSMFWAVRLLLNGDRNSFMLIAIVAIGGYVTFRKQAGRWVLGILCVIAIAGYNSIEALRSGKTGSLFGFFTGDGTVPSYGGDTSFNISAISVRAILASVPDHIDYGYGLYKLIGIGGILPFIRGLIIPPDMEFTQSSDVLNAVLLGPNAHWGVGSNVIADVYADFGAIAVPVLLFALGVFAAYVQQSLARFPESPWRGVVYLVTLALIAETPRYSIDFPVRPLVWVLLLFLAASMLRSRRSLDSQVPQPVRGSAA